MYVNTAARAAAAFIAAIVWTTTSSNADTLSETCKKAAYWPAEDKKASDPDIENTFSQLSKHYPRFKKIKAIQNPAADERFYNPRAALCPDGSALMIFPRKFIEEVRSAAPGGDTYWKWVFVFAHEYSHIALNHHLVSEACRQDADRSITKACVNFYSSDFYRGLELEADFWAAFTLGNMSATLEQTSAALKSMATFTSDEDFSHPPYEERIEKVREGWSQSSLASSSSRPRANSLDDFTMMPNWDIPDRELYSFSTPSILACAAKCADAGNGATCAAFSYDKWARFCYLKRAPLDKDSGKARAFSKNDVVLKFDVSSDTGVRKFFGSKKEPVKELPGTIALTEQQKSECNLFDSQGRTQFYDAAADIENTGPRNRTCISRCRGNPNCTAVQLMDKKCTFYTKVGATFPVTEKTTIIAFRRYPYDPSCPRQN